MDWVWPLVMLLRSASPAPDDRWAVVLADLDRARAEAYATGDPRRLDGVYVRGSDPQALDAATISDYADRGARVVGADLRVLSCRVIGSSPARVRLDVVDQLDEARVVWSDGSSRRLPRDQPSRHRVTLVRTADGWRIAGSVELNPRR